jgi:cullin-4
MFKDTEAAPEVNRQFIEASKLKDLPHDFNVTVISSGIWPHPDDVKVKIPKEVALAQQAFASYYDSKHNGRLLAWNQAMGSCIVKAPFPHGTKELQVSIPQAMVLDCFNSSEKLSVSELAKQSKLNNEQLHQALQSLSTGRHQILLIESGTEGLPQKSDVYVYNSGFTSRLVRIRLNTSAATELVEEKVVDGPANLHLEDKQHQIDAALVRIIKTARRMARSELVDQAITGLKLGGLPKEEVNKRIDLLMTRDFITKDMEDYLIYVP